MQELRGWIADLESSIEWIRSKLEAGHPAETLATAGEAMLFTTLVLSTGFAIYTLSSMPVLTNFGLLTAAAISLAFVADVLLAPALMTWLVEESR